MSKTFEEYSLCLYHGTGTCKGCPDKDDCAMVENRESCRRAWEAGREVGILEGAESVRTI